VRGYSPRIRQKDCGDSPHPDRIQRCDPTSPRKRGEVKYAHRPRRNRRNGIGLEPCRPTSCPLLRTKQPSCCRTAFAAGSQAAAGRRASNQLALLAKARDDRSALLIAPTGAGKTLAGILADAGGIERSLSFRAVCSTPPSAARAGGGETTAYAAKSSRPEFISTGRGVRRSRGLHTLYISPLKALAVDIARNLETPVSEMGWPSRSKPAPATRRSRGGSGSGAIRPTFCSPRRNSWRCCSHPTMRRFCSHRSGASCSTSCTRW